MKTLNSLEANLIYLEILNSNYYEFFYCQKLAGFPIFGEVLRWSETRQFIPLRNPYSIYDIDGFLDVLRVNLVYSKHFNALMSALRALRRFELKCQKKSNTIFTYIPLKKALNEPSHKLSNKAVKTFFKNFM